MLDETSPGAGTRRGRDAPAPLAPRATPLVIGMLVALAAVAALAYWDKQRESATTLSDFAQDQATLASIVASELGARLTTLRREAEALDAGLHPPRALDGPGGHAPQGRAEAPRSPDGSGLVIGVPVARGGVVRLEVAAAELLEGAMRIERSHVSRLLVRGPEAADLRTTDGRVITCDPVVRALEAGQPVVWLERVDAAALGLPSRRAAAGVALVDAGPLGRFGVAVVSSAERVRDREARAGYRLILGVLLAAGLVFVFGTIALRRQRRGLLLERELALAAALRERDAELATASRAATLGTLAMGIAHEVGTPLGVIAGRAEQLATRVSDDERASRAVRSILDQADRIRRTIRGFLDLVRGHTRELGDTPPAMVLEGAVALVEHRFAAAGVALVKRIPSGAPAIHCDVPMLQQALVNLLLNACDACDRGGRVEAAVESDGDRVTFRVVDDGAGITPEAAARATEPFFTTKPEGKGSGLGLAITSEIVKLHRGTLGLHAAPPRGTVASIVIPVPKVDRHVPA